MVSWLGEPSKRSANVHHLPFRVKMTHDHRQEPFSRVLHVFYEEMHVVRLRSTFVLDDDNWGGNSWMFRSWRTMIGLAAAVVVVGLAVVGHAAGVVAVVGVDMASILETGDTEKRFF